MTTVQKFEDLICWQKSRLLTKEIYKALKNCKDFGFKDQLQRAAVSIMSNIAEGFERGTRQELVNYLYIAKGSAGEVRAQLYTALDAGYLNIETLECSRLVQSFAQKVKGGARQGSQFKRTQKEDPMKEILRTTAPEIYKKFYGEK
ncbi:MAG: four helix bundle protein [Patescibacteria group bacterium]